APLVHRERAREHARSRVRQAEQLERTLQRSVLAVPTMERYERAVEARGDQLIQPAVAGIERMRVDALSAQRREHHAPAVERHLALGRPAAEQNGDLSEIGGFHFGSPMILTSGSRSMPCRRMTSARACSIRRSISAARAPPSGLTMKFACFSEMRAPPTAKPLRPQASMRRAAWSPSGLRNTEPAFGSPSGCVAMRRPI